MNYGYDNTCPNWNEDKKAELAESLSKELSIGFDANKQHQPYVEVDGLYQGVRLRRITHLSEEEQELLITRADAIYRRIMQGALEL